MASAALVPLVALTPPIPREAAPAARRPIDLPTSPHNGAAHIGDGHAETEGLVLAAASLAGDERDDAVRCPADAPVRRYDVVALAVDITLNRYLDHDPDGRMYALASDEGRIRAEEAANAKARDGASPPAVSLGLQGDAIQPLTLRVNQGECLRITLRNKLAGEPAGIHVHGAGFATSDGKPAVAANPHATAPPGGRAAYEWWIGSEPEGTHYFHSHALERTQTDHGLFGTIVIEPSGSKWLDSVSGKPAPTGWSAMIVPGRGKAFREYVIDYHEIGDETYRVLDRHGEFVPQVDPFLGAYRPSTRALNYRSEAFMNRMALQQERTGRFDESTAYSSYTFGDPATPIARAYLGDRVKQRVVHAGGEAFHVHHVHGGSIRWHRLADIDGLATEQGLVKRPPLLPGGSERVDSQSLGPSEVFDTENECGAGGCQQSAGDFLFHCHVAQHYFSGMWGIWRVYNTLQNGDASTDDLPPLLALPGRRDAVVPAVTSDRVPDEIAARVGVDEQLPPRGQRKGYDAAVWDWAVEDGHAVGEPEDQSLWPGRPDGAPRPGRPAILFDPRDGRLAYPHLRPHFGARPPFAPNHGPAPFLDPTKNGRAPPAPGASGRDSLCPEGTRLRQVHIDAVPVPVPRNRRANIVDADGELFVLQHDRAAVEADPAMRRPLAIRTNAGRDCLDVLFRSELADTPVNRGFAKVSLHIHMVQFDVQGSDGVDTGFNYEQSVRPFTVEGERLRTTASAGTKRIAVTSGARFQPGVVIAIGLEHSDDVEMRQVDKIDGDQLELDRPLDRAHPPGETVSTEFLRQRWYPDVQFGTAYFHDHVNSLHGWGHGLFGALVAEPPDASWHDPHTGEELASGAIADVHTSSPVTRDVKGSFRELVTFLQDDDPINRVGRSSGGALNLRAEPLASRSSDPARQFSSEAGDPETPILEARVGDPLVFRTLVAATNDVHTFHVGGHSFASDPFNADAPRVSTSHLGISERFDFAVPAAGGPRRRAGDYLIADTRSSKLQEGAWGILRVLDGPNAERLLPLPGRDDDGDGEGGDICPGDAPAKRFRLAAIDAELPMLDGGRGRAFVVDAPAEGRPTAPQPLVLHASVGDCLDVELANRTLEGPVSLHAVGLAYDPLTSAGLAVGRTPAPTIAPGSSRRYRFYAAPENGETVAMLLDGANPTVNVPLGLYGAVVISGKGASATDQLTRRDASAESNWSVDVTPTDGKAYRDVTLFLQDEDAAIGTHRMPYSQGVDGVTAINYQRAPFEGARPRDAATPLIQAEAGDRVRVHVIAPSSEQAQVFSIEGHEWPAVTGTGWASSVQVGAWEAVTLELVAGGRGALPGEYEYGAHRQPYREAGAWGRFVVACPRALPLRTLGGERSKACGGAGGSPSQWTLTMASVAAAIGLAAFAFFAARRRRRRPRLAHDR